MLINKVRKAGVLLNSIVTFVFILSLFSCNSEKPAITKKPEQSSDLSSAKISSGVESQQTAPPSSTRDKIIKKDSEVIPKNNLPIVEKAKLQLETINNTDVIKVIASGMDQDNDVVTLKYEWIKNGEPAGYGDTISEFRRGDKLSVVITPFDGKDYGHPKTLTTEIRNTTPKIIENKEIKFDGNIYTCQVKATDPDGDSLTFSLKSAPKDMIIDPSTGLIKWNVPSDFKGKAPIAVSVTDGHGGEAVQSLNLEIKTEKR